jgi:hypothetical protein
MLFFKQKWEQKMDSTGSRTIEPLFESKYFCFFSRHHVICSNKVRSILHSINKRGIYLPWTLERSQVPPLHVVQHESDTLTYLPNCI